MGIPGLINAIGSGERIALSRLAITHLERTNRPIRIAVDISIWLFQAQAGRGGKNPELRTLFFRLVRLLALPVHPLFVYDGGQKPPFKRGKATSRSYGSAPIIGLSKRMIDLFRFPRHDAPGEAEAECARLQRAGVVDAVMSNDVDALMFGSRFTVMNFSKESSTGTAAATHVDCYRTVDQLGLDKNVKLSRAGMILFAMLSGGDYLPSGVAKCGSKLASEIANAGFGDDLLEIVGTAGEDEMDSQLTEWRERLQYELDENESGYFQHKHKAVKIPEDFPDRTILSFYAKPIVSDQLEIEHLRSRLDHSWDHEIDILELRTFAAEAFDWKYRSGARSIVRKLAEPLLCRRLRLRQPLVAMQSYGSFIPNYDGPTAQKVYKSRKHYSTDGLSQVQLEMVPIDIVGLDLEAEEPNPPLQPTSSQMDSSQGLDDEEDPEVGCETEVPVPSIPSNSAKPRKWYNPYESEKIWVFETLATIGIPEIVDKWRKEQELKSMPKKPAPKKTVSKKKKAIDPGMKPGGILRYTTVTKPRSDLSVEKANQLIDAVKLPSSSGSSQRDYQTQLMITPRDVSWDRKTSTELSKSQTNSRKNFVQIDDDDGVIGYSAIACSASNSETSILRPSVVQHRIGVLGHARLMYDILDEIISISSDDESSQPLPGPKSPIRRINMSYSNATSPPPLLDRKSARYAEPSMESVAPTKRHPGTERHDCLPSKSKPPRQTNLGADFEPISLKTPARKPLAKHQSPGATGPARPTLSQQVADPPHHELIVLDAGPDDSTTLPVLQTEHLTEARHSSHKQARPKEGKQGKRPPQKNPNKSASVEDGMK